MDLLSRLLPSWRVQAQQSVNIDIHLFNLPPELFSEVVGLLSASSTACLALCCKGTHEALDGKSVLRKLDLKEARIDRADFLRQYVKDHSQYFFCHDCRTLHLRERVAPPGPLHHPREVLHCQKDAVTVHSLWYSRLRGVMCLPQSAPSSYELKFSHVQLALAEHRRPGTGIRLDALRFTEVSRCREPHREHFDDRLASYEPLVIRNELYLRVQQWFVYRRPRNIRIPQLICFDVCPHIEYARNYRYWHDLHESDNDKSSNRYLDQSELMCCLHCKVQFIVWTRPAQHGFAIVLTKVLGFGDGLDPLSWRWRSHTWRDSKLTPLSAPNGCVRLPKYHTLTQVFESTSPVPLQDLTEKNQRLVAGLEAETSMLALQQGKQHHYDVMVDQIDTRPRVAWWPFR